LDSWTGPHGNSIWAFMLITSSRKEYLLKLEDLSSEHHTSKYLSTVIDEVISRVGVDKFVAIVSDNAANIAGAREKISEKYPSILNVRCIAHCINLISSDIAKIIQVKTLVRYANIITRFFKSSAIGASLLKEAIEIKNIQGGGLKTYVETRWTTIYECTSSIWRLKDALQHVFFKSIKKQLLFF
jgi:hypothetical protein